MLKTITGIISVLFGLIIPILFSVLYMKIGGPEAAYVIPACIGFMTFLIFGIVLIIHEQAKEE